jgi:hypothetical protein
MTYHASPIFDPSSVPGNGADARPATVTRLLWLVATMTAVGAVTFVAFDWILGVLSVPPHIRTAVAFGNVMIVVIAFVAAAGSDEPKRPTR